MNILIKNLLVFGISAGTIRNKCERFFDEFSYNDYNGVF